MSGLKVHIVGGLLGGLCGGLLVVGVTVGLKAGMDFVAQGDTWTVILLPLLGLLLAVLLTNQGELADAEQTCRRLLALDEMHAGAHYLMALCREHASDLAGAKEHDQSAIYLDPGFAMPHLHLGLLAKRSGEPVVARRELSHAQLLLTREDASRLLLFGGGFSREALTRLCRAELSSLGADV